MKRYTRNQFIGALCAGALLMSVGFAAQAQTTPTPAGTEISNQATVNYTVGTVPQTEIKSTAVKFKVDRKLLLTVTKADSTAVEVSPGQSVTVLTYTVKNEGNDTEGVTFTATNEANNTASPFSGGPNDNFDVTFPATYVYVSQDGTGTYDSINDTAQTISQLAPGATAIVYVLSGTPITQHDGDSAVVKLTAQVAEPGADAGYTTAPGTSITTDQSSTAKTGADLENVLNIFASGFTGGQASADNAVLVKSATIAIAKTVKVLSDPTGATSPHAIPGAVMMYTITVSNTGTADATDVEIKDDLSGQSNLNLDSTRASIKIYNNGGTNNTNCNSPGAGVTCNYSSGIVDISGLKAGAGKTATVTFEVTIQ